MSVFGSYEFDVMTYPMYVRLRAFRQRLGNPKRSAWPAGVDRMHPRYPGENRFTFPHEREQGIGARGFDVAVPQHGPAGCGLGCARGYHYGRPDASKAEQ